MTSLEAKTKLLQQEERDEKHIDYFSAACCLIVIFLVAFEAWRFAA